MTQGILAYIVAGFLAIAIGKILERRVGSLRRGYLPMFFIILAGAREDYGWQFRLLLIIPSLVFLIVECRRKRIL